MPTSATGSKTAGFTPLRRSAENGFTSLRRSAENGFTSLRRSAENGFTPLRRSAENGFTLVELMVVIAIMAVATAAVMFAIPDPRGRLIDDAEKFAARASAVRDDAILQSRDMRVLVTATGYQVERRRQGRWQSLTDKPFAPARWADGTGTSGATSILFDATGAAVPATVTLARDDQRVAVTVSGNGAIRVWS
jgi:general secretion pathway protein H